MNYSKLPTLERVSLLRIAVTLWNQDDIRVLLLNFCYLNEDVLTKGLKWRGIEKNVLRKVSLLPQPKKFKEKLSCLIKPIGLQILDWIEYHNHSYLGVNLPSEFSWTSLGAIDEKKTAEVLIKDENLHITSRYKLACIYCLEDDIPELWKKIPKCYKHLFYRKRGPGEVNQEQLVVFWTYCIKGEVCKWRHMIEKRMRTRRTPYKAAFEYAVLARHKAAAEYFLQKLTFVEREESLVRFTLHLLNHVRAFTYDDDNLPYYVKKKCNTLYFLLSQMNEVQLSEVFERYSYIVLRNLLNWPFQDFFLETAQRMWTFLRDDEFHKLLKDISEAELKYKDYCYNELLGGFWQQSPMPYRKQVLALFSIETLLRTLLKSEDKENVTLILNDASEQEKEEIFEHTGKSICENLFHFGKYDLMKFFIQAFALGKNTLIRLRKDFRTVLCFTKERMKYDDSWKKFLEVLDELIQNYDKKRSLEDGNSGSPKKLCI